MRKAERYRIKLLKKYQPISLKPQKKALVIAIRCIRKCISLLKNKKNYNKWSDLDSNLVYIYYVDNATKDAILINVFNLLTKNDNPNTHQQFTRQRKCKQYILVTHKVISYIVIASFDLGTFFFTDYTQHGSFLTAFCVTIYLLLLF